MNGIIIIDKPAGWTSHDVVGKLRGILRERRIGHGGTLDPMATGMMTILLGKATRAAELFPNHDKSYRARFRLGITTDTLDITGQVQSESSVEVSRGQFEAVMVRYRGAIKQLPPMYSAVHAEGKRLYELAREGKEVERTPRDAYIERLELLEYDEATGEGELDVCCSKGTYIRTLVDDIGRELGCGATLTALRRTEAVGYGIEDALTLEEVQRMKDDGTITERIIPVDEALRAYRSCDVTVAQAVRYYNGGELSIERIYGFEDGGMPYVRVYGALGEDKERIFLGIAKVDREEGLVRPYKRFS